MRHPRIKHNGYRGKRATPWKYYVHDKPVRRGKVYDVVLSKDGVILWSGEIVG